MNRIPTTRTTRTTLAWIRANVRRLGSGGVLLAALLALVVGAVANVPKGDVALAAASGFCGSDLQCVKTYGDNLSQRRTLDLNNLTNDANNHSNLTAAQINAITQDAQASISSVQSLKQRLDGETDIAAARADVRAIFALDIYLLVLPRDYLKLYQEHQAYIQGQFVANEPQIQQAIQNAANKGVNVTQEQQQFSDLQAKVSDAGQKNSAAEALYASPYLATYTFPDTGSVFVQIRSNLQPARIDLQAAYQDLTAINTELASA